MTPRFSVRAIPQFRRAAERLSAQHPAFYQLLERAIEILVDVFPYTRAEIARMMSEDNSLIAAALSDGRTIFKSAA